MTNLRRAQELSNARPYSPCRTNSSEDSCIEICPPQYLLTRMLDLIVRVRLMNGMAHQYLQGFLSF